MTEPLKTIKVSILGEEYPIKSDASPEYLQELGTYVEEKILRISLKNKLPSKIKSEVLAAIIIADEYFSEKNKNAKIEQKLSELTGLLEEKLSPKPVN
ncbi:cell division protein ZapA [Candidatus Latescibacterota bacterium]